MISETVVVPNIISDHDTIEFTIDMNRIINTSLSFDDFHDLEHGAHFLI